MQVVRAGCLVALFVVVPGIAQDGGASTHWVKTINTTQGGISAEALAPTADGGHLVACNYYHGDIDAAVFKLAADGSVAWLKRYGTPHWDWLTDIQPTSDGGFVTIGAGSRLDINSPDPWLMKLDAQGNVLWQKTYVPDANSSAESICETSDGGLAFVGMVPTKKPGEDWTWDAWVVKLSSDGAVQWNKTFGTSKFDKASKVRRTSDGKMIVIGTINDNDGWVMKIDNSGQVLWERWFPHTNGADALVATSDGGCAFTATCASVDSPVSTDVFLCRLDGNGSVVWQKSYGGTEKDESYGLAQTADGGYVFAGYTYSFGVSDSLGGADHHLWIVKVDANGGLVWQKRYGGPPADSASAVRALGDGSLLVAGATASYTSSGGAAWLLKLKSDGTVPNNLWPNASTNGTAGNQTATPSAVDTYSGSKGIEVLPIPATTESLTPVVKQQAP